MLSREDESEQRLIRVSIDELEHLRCIGPGGGRENHDLEDFAHFGQEFFKIRPEFDSDLDFLLL